MSRIAVVTGDVLSSRMAGPAIRAFQIARELSAYHDVSLISTNACSITADGFQCFFARGHDLRTAVADADVIVVQGYVTYYAPWLIRSDKILIVDLYDPMHFEQLQQLGDRRPRERLALVDLTVRVLNEQLARGDFFLCASEEQRHLWLGHLGALGRVNSLNYGADQTLRRLIDVCPFGLPAEPPQRTRAALRGTVPGICADDRVVLWAGGVYNWFDPLSLIHAVDEVRRDHPDLRLYFLGMKHPNPEIPDMRMAWETRELSDSLGLTGTHVFFNEGWVDYDDRQNYLLDADVGVSTHFEHVETTFSFRTRILDYFWAGLPVVATGGDTLGSLVAREGLGVSVAERDIDGIASALRILLYEPGVADRCRERVRVVAQGFTWQRALAPLTTFCAQPTRAADATSNQARIVRRAVLPDSTAARYALRLRSVLRDGGPALVIHRVAALARARFGRGSDSNAAGGAGYDGLDPDASKVVRTR